MSNYKALLKHINTFVFDYDGVLTDGTVVLQADGEALRTANVKDGYAMQLAVKKGFRVVNISGGKSASMHKRFEALKIRDFFLGVANKLEVFQKFLKENGLKSDNVLYMGDDIPDYKPMKETGIACCPSDAAPEIKSISHYISDRGGGKGCVRDVIEQTLKVQGKWMDDDGFKW
jgi:3-deoxy-D-manno-octulosonate 8-phosphate phosphatase (KDO 8-P phosphatase)